MRHLTSRPTARLTVAAATAVFVLAGCGGDDAGEADATADPPETTEAPAEEDAPDEAPEAAEESADEGAGTEVLLRDEDGFVFEPAEISVAVGDTVTWVHEGSISHTVTADDDSFSSGTLAAGDTFEVTFDESGSYPYICDFHGSMRGTVTVE